MGMGRIQVGVIGLLAIVGCNAAETVDEPQLAPLRSCSEVEAAIRAAALAEMNRAIDVALDDALSRRAVAQTNKYFPTTDDGGADQVSGTNSQVTGVDEADFVKNDSRYIYLVRDGAFRIVEAWPPLQSRELARLRIEGTPRQLFVHNDRALVYSTLSSSVDDYEASDRTKITILDIGDRRAPRLVRELKVSGAYVTARRIGDAVHTVLGSPAIQFRGLTYRPEELLPTSTTPEIWMAYARLREKNTRIINEAPLRDRLPAVLDTLGSGDAASSCAGIYRSGDDEGPAFTTVLSLDMTRERPAHASSLLGSPGTTYVSATALYVAAPRWDASTWKQSTTVHKLALTNEPPSSRYVASGVVDGRVLGQLSLDEREGHLRVATTIGYVPSSDAHNALTVLSQQGSRLVAVGRLGNIAPSEDIRSVRFSGERAYIVTFKKTDPLFVLDLRDPQRPTVMGELKIPGFSTYIHEMDRGHLLTIGYDASEQGSFAWFSGVMLQIFDVSVPTDPLLMHKEVIGTRGSSSEALANHLAFTYFPPKNLLALPMTICEGGSGSFYGAMTFSGLMVYDVTVLDGFKLRGKVSHAAPGQDGCHNWWSSASSKVKRSIVMDDYVFSISDDSIKVTDLSDFSTELITTSD